MNFNVSLFLYNTLYFLSRPLPPRPKTDSIFAFVWLFNLFFFLFIWKVIVKHTNIERRRIREKQNYVHINNGCMSSISLCIHKYINIKFIRTKSWVCGLDWGLFL